MLEVVSVKGYSDYSDSDRTAIARRAVSARRGGLLYGTKVATTSGWKLVERLKTGDRVRTLDNGFQELRRVSVDHIAIESGETRPEHLPVQVPARAAYNGRRVWLMPEQGMAVDLGKTGQQGNGVSVIPARMLSGVGRMTSQTPAQSFEVVSLFFDHDEVVFIEGGFQAFCSAGRLGRSPAAGSRGYDVPDADQAEAIVESIASRADISAFANPLGALPAPIPQEPIFPIRPQVGVRRPGRPGRPHAPALFLRPEWQT